MSDVPTPGAVPFDRAAQRRGKVRLIIAGLAVAILIAADYIFGVDSRRDARPTSPPAAVQTYEGLSREHTTERVGYSHRPPVGGPHAPIWQNCGFYDGPVPDERAVHSLERGAVWVTFDPSLPSTARSALQHLASNNSHVLVSSYLGLSAPVVLTAWGVQLPVQGPEDPLIEHFLASYRNGPQAPETGAPCAGGASDLASTPS